MASLGNKKIRGKCHHNIVRGHWRWQNIDNGEPQQKCDTSFLQSQSADKDRTRSSD